MQKNSSDKKKIFRDYEIFAGKIRLVQDGKPPIVIDRDEAIDMAKSKDMNLVQIAYNKNDFPHAVCKIIDYSKHLYEQKKREKEAKKQARANESSIKEVNFTIRIDDGDFNIKCNHIKDFINDGNKVKIGIRLSRRESNLKSYANDMMKRILESICELADIDQAPSFSELTLSGIVRKKKI